jgi:hypothetical protein
LNSITTTNFTANFLSACIKVSIIKQSEDKKGRKTAIKEETKSKSVRRAEGKSKIKTDGSNKPRVK